MGRFHQVEDGDDKGMTGRDMRKPHKNPVSGNPMETTVRVCIPFCSADWLAVPWAHLLLPSTLCLHMCLLSDT